MPRRDGHPDITNTDIIIIVYKFADASGLTCSVIIADLHDLLFAFAFTRQGILRTEEHKKCQDNLLGIEEKLSKGRK